MIWTTQSPTEQQIVPAELFSQVVYYKKGGRGCKTTN